MLLPLTIKALELKIYYYRIPPEIGDFVVGFESRKQE